MSYIGQGLPADVFSGFTIDKFTGDGTANKALHYLRHLLMRPQF